MELRLKVSMLQGKPVIELPDAIVVDLQLREDDEVDVTISRTVHGSSADRESFASLRKYRGRMPVGFKLDRDEANRR